MDIRLAPQIGPAPEARPASGTPVQPRVKVAGASEADFASAMKKAAQELQQALATEVQAKLPRTNEFRAELGFDDSTHRLFARLVDTHTGEVVVQYPSEEAMRMLAKARAQVGPLVKADA